MPYNVWYAVPQYSNAGVRGGLVIRKMLKDAKLLAQKYGTFVVRLKFNSRVWNDRQVLDSLTCKQIWAAALLDHHEVGYKAPKVKPPSDEVWEHPLELCERCGNLLHRDAAKLEVVICDRCVEALRELANG